MKKLIKIIVFTVILFFFFLPASVSAASNVTFEGESDKLVFIPESRDLFGNFKNIFPGETRTQNILLKNTSSRKLDFYLKIEKYPMMRDGLDNLREELISLLIFNINYGGRKIYSQKFNDIVRASHLPAEDKKKEGYIYLATLKKGESMNIGLELYTPGNLIDNRFQDLDIYVDWHFYVEDLEAEAKVIDIKNYPCYKLLRTGGYLLGNSGLTGGCLLENSGLIGGYLLGILGLGILALGGTIIGVNRIKNGRDN